MIRKLLRFLSSTTDYRHRYGLWNGLRMARELRGDYTLAPGTPYPVLVPGWRRPVLLRAGTTDLAVFREVVVQDGLGVVLAREPRVILDAGAHIGLGTLSLAHRYPHARIISLEVDPGNLEMLRRNTEGMGQVTVLHQALWSGRSRVSIKNPEAPTYAYQVTAEGSHHGGAVESVGVADVMQDFALDEIDLLKIDIEGAEIEVFSAADRSWVGRVGVVVIELHDWLREGCSQSVLAALASQSWVRSQHGEMRCSPEVPCPLTGSAGFGSRRVSRLSQAPGSCSRRLPGVRTGWTWRGRPRRPERPKRCRGPRHSAW